MAEYREPPGVERAPPTERPAADAARRRDRRGDLWRRSAQRSEPQERDPRSRMRRRAKWYAKHKVVPINHMVVVTEALSQSNPDAVREVFRLLAESKRAAGLPKPGSIDFLPFGVEACRPALEHDDQVYAQQKLLPRAADGRRAVRRDHPGAYALRVSIRGARWAVATPGERRWGRSVAGPRRNIRKSWQICQALRATSLVKRCSRATLYGFYVNGACNFTPAQRLICIVVVKGKTGTKRHRRLLGDAALANAGRE